MILTGLSKVAKLPNGAEVKEGSNPMTLRELLVTCCLNVIEGDDKMPATEKLQLGQLAYSLHESQDEIDISIEMAAKLKIRAAKMFPIGVFWAFHNFIEPSKKE